jgi:hypothetical protein
MPVYLRWARFTSNGRSPAGVPQKGFVWLFYAAGFRVKAFRILLSQDARNFLAQIRSRWGSALFAD